MERRLLNPKIDFVFKKYIYIVLINKLLTCFDGY